MTPSFLTRDIVPTSGQLYVNRCRVAWTSDDTGRHTWFLGWAVYETEPIEDEDRPFNVYEDDGRGNGDFVAGFDTLEEARAAVDRMVAEADLHARQITPGLIARARTWLSGASDPGAPYAYNVSARKNQRCAICNGVILKGERCMRRDTVPMKNTYLCDPCTRLACQPTE